MAKNNNIVVRGNLCDDCVVFKEKVVKARVAINRGEDKEPLYLNVTLFTDDPAMLDRCDEQLVKGTAVEITGALDVSNYKDEAGYQRTNVGIIADDITVISSRCYPKKRENQKENRSAADSAPAPQTKPRRVQTSIEQIDDEGSIPF